MSKQSGPCSKMKDCPAMFHWSDCLSNPAIKLYTQAEMDAARADTWDKAIKIVQLWMDAYKSCREHFNDPCCHVRLATTIGEAMAMEKAKDGGKS